MGKIPWKKASGQSSAHTLQYCPCRILNDADWVNMAVVWANGVKSDFKHHGILQSCSVVLK